ncbi:hypothetical protein E1B28_003177 [Marasmius oreades]|uniref:MYND-type domain-containing protein n=1 Tax=Marasmius oreades TaxID=181124 RepID=A0A9P7RM11_9AGAR|nr:uncharacterized protein E1B28_003177 [Marasmius oreades]KAG7085630.1 hypothetical protein E1B28_003177 [Marasmius oreades]
MDPNTDLDNFGTMVFFGRVDRVKDDIRRRLQNYGGNHLSFDCSVAHLLSSPESQPQHTRLEKVAEEIFKLRYGAARTPIMNCIGQARILLPQLRDAHLEIARYILDTFAPVVNKRVNIVDAPDLAGTTALAHAISTKPAFDPEFAQVLWEAGGNINRRNRYGATAAHEFCMVWKPDDRAILNRAKDTLKWFLEHGGNTELADGDGMKPSNMIMRIRGGLEMILKDHEAKRRQRGREPKRACVTCGERDRKLKECSRCESTRYCAPPRRCQRADWSVHRLTCKRPTAQHARPDRQQVTGKRLESRTDF